MHLARPIEVLHNFVDCDEFRPVDVPEDPDLIAFAGTLCDKKGVRELLAAFCRVAETRPAVRLLLLGKDTRIPGTGHSFIEDAMAGLSPAMRSRVTIAGAVPHSEMPRTLAPAAVCVFPSHAEAFGIAWIEAMAMGKACVISATGPGPEVAAEEGSALLANPSDPAAIAHAMARLLDDPVLRRRCGLLARDTVERHFSSRTQIPLNEVFFAQLVERGRTTR